MKLLRRNLMIALLVGIPAMAMTNFRVWSGSSPDHPSAELQPPVVTSMESMARRLPEVDINQQPWFAQAQQQLQACGATYVRLERWNFEQPIFHFHCELGVEPRSLEALSSSPRAAVQQVLNQATAWHDSTNPRRQSVTSSRPSSRPRIAEPNPRDGTSWR